MNITNTTANSYFSSNFPEVYIRTAAFDDAPALLEIYAPYVRNTAVTFEYEVPSIEEFAGRIAHTLERFPYLTAQKDGQIIGYAYASPFHSRAAYAWSVEVSIYVALGFCGQGIGRELYRILEDILKKQNVLNLYACIACTETEDEYLTNASLRFHEHMGYRINGTFPKCGRKFGRWYDMVWMEKIIGEHKTDTPPIISFRDLL